MGSRLGQEHGSWLIHFFQRERSDDPGEAVPAMEFLSSLPVYVAAKFQDVLQAVAEAPPPSFPGGGKWKAMRGEMGGFYEVRIQGARANYRLLCLLASDADDLGGPSIICVYGFSKPKRQAAKQRDYRRAKTYRAEFDRTRRVIS